MSENTIKTASQWVDTIDIHGDKIADTKGSEVSLKESLKKDLQILWERKAEGKISDAEYNRYAAAAKVIFEKQGTGFTEIENKYRQERNKILRESNSFLDNLSLDVGRGMKKVRNLGTDAIVTLQQKLISEDTVQAYNDSEGNHLISIKDFEKQLKNNDIETLNGLALKNYFAFLQTKAPLTQEILLDKLGSSERLLQLSILWGTNLQKGAHARSGHGKIEKFNATINTWLTGTSERKIENDIFKKVIINDIKKQGIDTTLFTQENSKDRTKKIGLDDLEKMNYEKIIDQFEIEFKGKIVTGKLVQEFFKKKISEHEEKIQKLKTEQEKLTGGKTVQAFFGGFKFSTSTTDITDLVKNKKLDDLSSEQKNSLILKIENTEEKIPGPLRDWMDKQKAISSHTQVIRDVGKLTDSTSTEIIANTQNNTVRSNGSSKKELKKVTEVIVQAGRSKDSMQLKEQNNAYAEILAQIGYSGKTIVELTKNKKILGEVLSQLEAKNLQGSELYIDLRSQMKLDERVADIYVMARENISEEQLGEQKRQGRKVDLFVQELYLEDVKQKKTTDFTVPSSILSKNNQQERGTLQSTLSTLTENSDPFPLEGVYGNIKTENCSVIKRDGVFILSIDGNTEECTSPEKVEQTLESYNFFYELGLSAIAPSMRNFLDTVTMSDSTLPKFDIQKGFHKRQQMSLLRVVDTIFGLGMKEKMGSKSTGALVSDFKEMLKFQVGQKEGFDLRLQKIGILSQTGVFRQEGLRQLLRQKKEA